MTKLKSEAVVIGGVEYVPKGSSEPTNSNIKIVVLQRGWVFVGRWKQEGDMCSLDNAYTIRTWGTSKGLGQLALEGKQSTTKLDKAGRVEFHQLTVVAAINADEALWNSELV